MPTPDYPHFELGPVVCAGPVGFDMLYTAKGEPCNRWANYIADEIGAPEGFVSIDRGLVLENPMQAAAYIQKDLIACINRLVRDYVHAPK